MTCDVFRSILFELKRVTSQQITSADSVHRNIAEGYCRRSIKEYLNFLNISLGSLGESVSGLFGYRKAKQISGFSKGALNPFFEMQPDISQTVSGDNLAIGVESVEFPKFLDRVQIVTRENKDRRPLILPAILNLTCHLEIFSI